LEGIMSLKRIDKKDIIETIQKSFSYAQALRRLKQTHYGGAYKSIKKFVIDNNVDISHFKGRAWRRDLTSKPLSCYLKNGKHIPSSWLKKRLIAEGLMEYKCSKCGNNGIWNNIKLTLELDHINGDHYDNRLKNLRI